VKIGFDAKRAFHNTTGLGNYSRSIISSVAKIRKQDQLYLITPSVNFKQFNLKNDNTHIIQPPLFSNGIYWRFKGVNKQLEKFKIDIYHGLSNEIPYGIKLKSIVTIHDLLFLKYPEFYNYIDHKIYHFKSKLACKNANAIIATSQQTKNDIIHFFNIKEDKIHVIYQTCQSEFIQTSNKIILPDNISNAVKNPFILYVGSIEERKNLIFLLQALSKTNKEIKLICVGKKGNYYKQVARFISEKKLNNRVTFLNIYDTKILSTLYQKSRALIYPSIDEGFGIPIIEAMYSKTPVITSNQSIFQEIGGKNSYYFEKGQVDSLVEKILEIWHDSKERDNKITLNFKYVQKFNANTQANQIINLYQKLM
tara:strand:+ start:571 stop:1668 length:1098 start_codon:yes stop_codon:yes gene_type:complete